MRKRLKIIPGLKEFVYVTTQLLARFISFITTWGPVGQLVSDSTQSRARSKQITINHEGTQIIFAVPTTLTRWRAKTFSSKEPETLKWIDSFEKNSNFWDVGANIGLYSIYAALKKNCRVVAVEPSVFNLELLAKNINLNLQQNNVLILPIAVDEFASQNMFNLSSLEIGGALSTFRETFGYNGLPLEIKFKYKSVGIGIEKATNIWNIAPPDYLKIDVDGIEHLVLAGIGHLIRSTRSILIEVNKSFLTQSNSLNELLISQHFNLTSEFEILAENLEGQMFNQIWTKS